MSTSNNFGNENSPEIFPESDDEFLEDDAPWEDDFGDENDVLESESEGTDSSLVNMQNALDQPASAMHHENASDTDTLETYHYEPLDLEGRSFRLLRLRKGRGAQIDCELFQAWLHGDIATPFEASAYTWGTTVTSRFICVNNKRLVVTENLYTALYHLRKTRVDRIMWVDAVCNDQSNDKERGHQVQQMGRIYAQADEVIFWLGAATLHTEILMRSLKELDNLAVAEPTGTWTVSDERWRTLWRKCGLASYRERFFARQEPIGDEFPRDTQEQLEEGLNHLLTRSWFKRVWVLQEVANARRAVVQCGFQAISSRTLYLAPHLIRCEVGQHCQAVLDIMPGIARQSSWWASQRGLCSLLRRFSRSEATDARDMIYALIDIAVDGAEALTLQPDYTKMEIQLLDDAALYFFGFDKSTFTSMCDFLESLEATASQSLLSFAENGCREDLLRILSVQGYYARWELSSAHDHRFKEFALPQSAYEAAARNTAHGGEIMDILYQISPVPQVEKLLFVALHNIACAENIIRVLLSRKGQAHDVVASLVRVEHLLQPVHRQFMQGGLLENLGNELFIATVTATVSNDRQRYFTLENLLRILPISTTVFSPETVTAAISNEVCGTQLAHILFAPWRHRIGVTEEMLFAAVGNSNHANAIIARIFLDRKDVQVSAEILRKAIYLGHCRPTALRTLIEHLQNDIKVETTIDRNGETTTYMINSPDGWKTEMTLLDPMLQVASANQSLAI